MIGYKVVLEQNGEFFSPLTRNRIEYFLNFPAAPKEGNGPLCVFDDLDLAEFYASFMGSKTLAIFKCEYVPSNAKHIWYRRFTYDGWATIATSTPLNLLPKGTRLASSVTLLERVK